MGLTKIAAPRRKYADQMIVRQNLKLLIFFFRIYLPLFLIKPQPTSQTVRSKRAARAHNRYFPSSI